MQPQVGMGMRFEYDRQGRLCRRVSDNNLVRTWHYQGDSLTPRSVCYEDGTAAYFEYDIEGNLVKVTDALGHSQSFDYDAFDLLSQAIDPLGAVTRYH
ncbi:RHS repeat domain-containing protein, partial [Salinivibrio socompensis]|uniref:RHS repeat domain-containing protein n=1 Tax=Salinivibrio socompensis TaxID=1510206 RepID=UPI0013E38DC2